MALTESRTIYDGFTTLVRGVDSGNAPSLIGQDQVAFAMNTTFRHDYPQPRPGWSQITLTGDDLNEGKWQGAHSYIDGNGRPYIIACVGGQVLRVDVSLNVVTNLSSTSGISLPAQLPLVWMTQAERYLPIQNGYTIPVIWDGTSLRESNPVAFGGTELPVGTVMEYNNGRLWVALPDRQSFVAGDLAYSITGTDIDVLSFTENEFINGGGSFAMPSNAGNIIAMKTVALQDSTLGQGPLQVFGVNGSASMNAPFDRTTWQQLSSPIQSVSMLAPGPAGQMAVTTVNGDLWYRSQDGVRSFMVARRDHGTWVNTPLSHEMERLFRRDDPHLGEHTSCVVFDNRLLCTTSGYRATVDGVEYGVAWRGLAVLDFNPVSSMFDRTQPTWEGAWSGLQILQIVTVNYYGTDRCFIFALNSDYEIELWELSKNLTTDNVTTPIQWFIETKSYGFQDQSESLKQLARTERWLSQVSGEVEFTVEYRPDGFWGWLPLDSGTVCATTGMCDGPGCGPLLAPQIQYRGRKISASPDPAECEECNDKPYRNAFDFQFKLSLTGFAALRRFRAAATVLPEKTTGGCLGEETCCEETGCEANIWAYES